MIKLTVIAALAAVAISGPAVAGSIGGGVGVVGMQSASGGAVQGGGINGGASALAGVTGSQTTQAAGTTGLAGTRLTLDKTGASIVSEHNTTGWSSQTMVGGSLGFAGSGGIGGSTFNGASFSQGSYVGIHGFLGF